MVNTENGELLWEWKDIRTRKEWLVAPYATQLYQNILILRNGRRLYGINTDSGTTVWQQRCTGGDELTLFGNMMFFGGEDARLWRGDARTGTIDTVFFIRNIVPPSPAPLDIYETRQVYPFIADNQDTLVAVSYGFGYATQFEAWYLLYNLSKRKLVYNQNILPRSHTMSGLFSSIQRLGNRLYFVAARSIVCHDIKTGKQIWKRDFPGSLGFSSMTLFDSTLVANCDEMPQYLYALDPSTGAIRWKEQNAGSLLGQLFMMDGVIYLAGGSDGKLHAIDLKTGKHRWKISCPNQYNDSDDIFYGNVTGKDGKIFVRSGLHLYCYKVIQ